LNVSAKDQTTNKIERITIKNDLGRLSEVEVQKMVDKAKEMEEEDKKILEKINSKHSLEQYLFGVNNSIHDQFDGKINNEDKKILLSKIDSSLKWMEYNINASKEDFENKKKRS